MFSSICRFLYNK